METGFREWLILLEAEESLGATLSPNINIPGHLRTLSISVPDAWLRKKFSSSPQGNPKHTFRRQVNSPAFFETFFPGQKIHIRVVGGKSFWTRMNLKYDGQKGQEAMAAALKDLDDGKEVVVGLEVGLVAEESLSPSAKAYLTGYTGGVHRIQNLTSVYPKEEDQQHYWRGRYDARHFYPFGTSAPDVEKPEVVTWGWGYTAGQRLPIKGWKQNVTPAVFQLIDGELEKYPKKFARYIRNKIDVDSILDAIGNRVVVADQKLGVEGARKIVRRAVEADIADYEDKVHHDEQSARHALEKHRSSVPDDPSRIAYTSGGGWGHPKRDVTAGEQWDDLMAYYSRLHRGANRRLAAWQKRAALKHPEPTLLPDPEPRTYNLAGGD